MKIYKKKNPKNTELRGKSNRKDHNCMAKSNDKKPSKTNGQELSYSYLSAWFVNKKDFFHLNRYCIVEFSVGNEISIVPDNWVKDADSCYWPNWKSSSRIEKAVKNKDEPDDTFELYEVSRVMYRSNSYLKVLLKIKIAEDQSDLQTDAEDLVQKRKRKPNSRYGDLPSSSESASDESPVKRKKQPPTKQRPSISERSLLTLPPLPVFPSPPHISVNQSSSNNSPTTPIRPCMQEVVFSPSRTNKQVSTFEKKLLTILEEVKGHVIQNTKLLNTLIKKGDKPTEGNEIPEGIYLPVSTREEFESLEAKLQNEEAGKKLINHLGTIGGDSVTECSRRTLKYTINHQLAMTLNWTGLGDKKAFGNSKLLLVIRRAVRKNRFSANASDNDIDSVIKDWFRYSKDREGGRKRRADKKKQAQQQQTEQTAVDN